MITITLDREFDILFVRVQAGVFFTYRNVAGVHKTEMRDRLAVVGKDGERLGTLSMNVGEYEIRETWVR